MLVNGGIINAYGTNARLGAGEWVVVEADESDGTFLRLPATVAVVTNADPDHLDFYGTFEHMRDAFQRFVENVPFYGFAVLCLDHPEVQAMVGPHHRPPHHHLWLSARRPMRAPSNVRFSEGASHFDVRLHRPPQGHARRGWTACSLPMPGEHNVQNRLAAIVVARELGVSRRSDPQGAGRIQRRGPPLHQGGRSGTAPPSSTITPTIPSRSPPRCKAARQAYSGPIVAVVQPHRYTRLRDTFEQFATCLNDADVAVIAPVYAAGEQPIEGINRDTYAEALRAHGHRNVITIDGEDDLAAAVAPYRQARRRRDRPGRGLDHRLDAQSA